MFPKRTGCFCLLFCALPVFGQNTTPPGGDLGDKALREFRNKDWTAAERDFRDVVRLVPANVIAQIYLGQSLYRQERYSEAAIVFEKARDLEKGGKALNTALHRVLTDQLVMCYGVVGELKKTHILLDEAIAKDPDYPLNYYNLACANAEESDKASALVNLQKAFDRKANLVKGEEMPDPRIDSSFLRYMHDSDFASLTARLGFK